MSPTMQSLGIDRLSVIDRLALVNEIWDSITSEPEVQEAPLADWQKAELERRIATYDADPKKGVAWEDVEKEILDVLEK